MEENTKEFEFLMLRCDIVVLEKQIIALLNIQ
jgi:hypothetical protein